MGWLEGDGLSAKGRAEREAIEVATDQQMAPALDALGDDFDELIAIITPWGRGRRGRPRLPRRGERPHRRMTAGRRRGLAVPAR